MPVFNGGKALFAFVVILIAYAVASGGEGIPAMADEQSAIPPSAEASQPGPLESLIQAGDAARNSGDLSRSADLYKQATTIDPRSIEAWLRLGDAEAAARHIPEAGQAYRAADAIDDSNPQTAFRLGEIALLAGDAPAAIAVLEHALKTHKDDPRLNSSAGVAYTIEGKYELARQHYQAAMAVNPFDPSVRNNYGILQLATGDLQGALATFLALAQLPQTSDRYRINLALVYLALGRSGEALATASGISEAQLRQMLAVYYHPNRPDADGTSATAVSAKPEVNFVNPKPADTAAPAPPLPASTVAPIPAEQPVTQSPANPAVPPRRQTASLTDFGPSDTSAAEKPAPVDAPSAMGEYKVQIGSVRSEAEAHAEWSRLERLYPDLLNGLSLTVARADLGAKGVYYRLQVGPIADAETAAQRCAELSARNGGCIVLQP